MKTFSPILKLDMTNRSPGTVCDKYKVYCTTLEEWETHSCIKKELGVDHVPHTINVSPSKSSEEQRKFLAGRMRTKLLLALQIALSRC